MLVAFSWKLLAVRWYLLVAFLLLLVAVLKKINIAWVNRTISLTGPKPTGRERHFSKLLVADSGNESEAASIL